MNGCKVNCESLQMTELTELIEEVMLIIPKVDAVLNLIGNHFFQKVAADQWTIYEYSEYQQYFLILEDYFSDLEIGLQQLEQLGSQSTRRHKHPAVKKTSVSG